MQQYYNVPSNQLPNILALGNKNNRLMPVYIKSRGISIIPCSIDKSIFDYDWSKFEIVNIDESELTE